jgi:hypothetical protein
MSTTPAHPSSLQNKKLKSPHWGNGRQPASTTQKWIETAPSFGSTRLKSEEGNRRIGYLI